MTQKPIDFDPPTTPEFHGPDYDPMLDEERLSTQQWRVCTVMLDGRWRSLSELSAECRDRWPDTRFPEASLSARLRTARNEFGFTVDRQRRGDEKHGLFEYRMERPTK